MRDAYVREAEGDMSRAILVACIDMTALKAYVQDIEALAIQHGASLEETLTARPVALDTPERPRLSLVETLR
jgi:hypothetical protein